MSMTPNPSRILTAQATCCAATLAFCLAAIPGSASARTHISANARAAACTDASACTHITVGFETDEFTGLRTLTIRGDDAPSTIAPGCSGDQVTVNGVRLVFTSLTVRCAGEFGPQNITVFGGGGNDLIILTGVTRASFPDLVQSHLGDPEGRQAPTDEVVAVGGPGNDTMIGGPLGENFNDLSSDAETGGGDTVHGNGGNDAVRGTTGNDKLFGDAGDDVISVERGADVAHGGAGDDAINALGAGADTSFGSVFDRQPDKFYGEAGKDGLYAGAGNDLLDGGPGSDYIDGGAGNDLMFGRAGADGLLGSGGADTIFGGSGNDYIRGGPGKDKIYPGSGKNDVKQ